MENLYSKSFADAIILCERRTIPADYVYEMHWHDYIELEVILSGEAEHIYNSRLTKVACGHAYIITPHDFHAFHALSEVTLINVCFDMHILVKEVQDVLSTVTDKHFHCVFDKAQLADVIERLTQIDSEQKEKTPLAHAMSKAILTAMLVRILRLSENTVFAAPTLAQRAISFVHTNFRQPITLAMLAAAFSVTPNYMGKVFTAHTGMPFNRYLNELRLKYACNMLRFSTLPAAQIAVLSGYSSVEYFFSVFKRLMGVTPREYRDGKC